MTAITCSECGYDWDYTGELWHANCPRCNTKVKSPLHPDNVDEQSDEDTEAKA